MKRAGERLARNGEARAGTATPAPARGRGRPGFESADNKDILIGIDAGTSMIKCAAFSTSGELLAARSRANRYDTSPDGAAVQNLPDTRDALIDTLSELVAELGPDRDRIKAVAVTAQGDGTWLVDENNEALHEGWLWLDSRAAGIVTELERSAGYATVFATTGTTLNAGQMRSQMLWMERHQPDLLDAAATACHCKDYLYACLTGHRATDPSEALLSFGDFRRGVYAPAVMRALGLDDRAHLLPPIVDGCRESHPLLDSVARTTGLPAALPITLGFVDVICSALGGGLYDAGAASAMTLTGTTGIHMRYTESADRIVLPEQPSGYTLAFPGGGFVQLQTNMAATLNIDWILDIARDVLSARGIDTDAGDLFGGLDERILAARPGAALYHPYISPAGERGPFIDSRARASFAGLDRNVGYHDLVRAVYEGLALAARDCYASMGRIPDEIRLGGGAAQSLALRRIMASVLNRPIRVADRPEAGAAGAAMIAAVRHGYFDGFASCTAQWVTPSIGDAVQPDSTLASLYDGLFEAYVAARNASQPVWRRLAALRAGGGRQ